MSTYETLDWYDAPRFYDLVFDEDTQREADFLEGIVAKHGRRGRGRVLEPACGSGRLVAELARRGWRATGTDLSEPMLAFGRQRLRAEGLKAVLRKADMADFKERGSFELVHCLVSTFKYLATEVAARSHLECVARHLTPGGLYVLGFHLTDYDNEAVQRERWVVERDGTRIVCNLQGWPADKRRRTEAVRSRLLVEEEGVRKRTETQWTFRTYDLAQVRRLLRSVPALRLCAVYDFGYELDQPGALDDEILDTVLILQRAE